VIETRETHQRTTQRATNQQRDQRTNERRKEQHQPPTNHTHQSYLNHISIIHEPPPLVVAPLLLLMMMMMIMMAMMMMTMMMMVVSQAMTLRASMDRASIKLESQSCSSSINMINVSRECI